METVARRRHLAALAAFGAVIFLLVLQLFPPSDLTFVAGVKAHVIRRLIFQGTEFWPDSLSLPGVPWLSIPILVVSLVWFWRHKTLWEYLLPVTGLLLLFAIKHVEVWHQGVLFVLWVFVVWLGFERQSLGVCRGGARLRLLDKLFPVVATLVAVIQIGWSVPTLQNDLAGSYSGSRQAAAYLKANDLQSKTIFATAYHAVAILPYFQDNIFANHNNGKKPAFWWWSANNPLIQGERYPIGNLRMILEDVRRRQPEVVILRRVNVKGKVEIPLAGYAPVADCVGTLYWKGRYYQNDTFLILWREDAELPGTSCAAP